MGSKCGKYEEWLSAYLDGRLTPDEMAETAAHLDGCSECSALLEKMHRLDGLASDTSLDFDDVLMEGLSERIAVGIENIEDTKVKPVERKSKIIPIWYRYVAVAASIVVVFFAGRTAFRETGMEPTRHRLIPTPSQMSKPQPSKEKKSEPVESSKPQVESVITEDEAISDQMTTPDVGRQEIIEMHPQKEKKDADPTGESRSKSEAGEISAPKIAIPKPAMIETTALEDGSQHDLAEIVDSDKLAATPASAEGGPSDMADLVVTPDDDESTPTDVKIAGQIVDEETDVSNESETVIQLNKRTDKVIFDTIASPGIVDSRKGVNYHSVSESPPPPPPPPDKEQGKGLLTVDSLEVLYAQAVSGSDRGMYNFKAEASQAIQSRSKVDKFIALIDSVEAVSESRKSDRRLENLYIQARANYDLYRQTREKDYLDRAREFKSALSEIINQKLEVDENNTILLDYKAKIERWRF